MEKLAELIRKFENDIYKIPHEDFVEYLKQYFEEIGNIGISFVPLDKIKERIDPHGMVQMLFIVKMDENRFPFQIIQILFEEGKGFFCKIYPLPEAVPSLVTKGRWINCQEFFQIMKELKSFLLNGDHQTLIDSNKFVKDEGFYSGPSQRYQTVKFLVNSCGISGL